VDDQATTTELVVRARAGDDAAWRALIHRFRNVIWAATRTFRFDRTTRDDVFQMTCLRLVDHLGSVREPERLAGWLAVTARRECLAIVRDRMRLQPRAGFDDVGSTEPGAEAIAIRDETVAAVAAALDELDEDCRELLRLLVVDPPLGYEAIATLIGRPIGSIGPTRARCLEKLSRRPSIASIKPPLVSSERREETT
jgi:RNA polymerase sigma factor (sigma-70 family)